MITRDEFILTHDSAPARRCPAGRFAKLDDWVLSLRCAIRAGGNGARTKGRIESPWRCRKMMRVSIAKLLSGTLCCAVFALMAGLSGCNTVEGFGRDLGKLGNKIESKAQQKKRY